MKTTSRQRLATLWLAVGLAAAVAPAAQAAFPDGDPTSTPAIDRAQALAARARMEPRLPAAEAIPATPAPVAEPTSGGFDWADAAVGAGVALGGIALAGGALVAVRRSGLATR